MKRLISLAVVVAFFVTVPQCLGQSQDAEKDAAQLLTEQQLLQMFHQVMAQGKPENKICHLMPNAPGSAEGIIRRVRDEDLQEHLDHGDCEEGDYIATKNDGQGGPCECLCPDGTVKPCGD